MGLQEAYSNQITVGDQVQVIAIVERVEQHGDDVVLYVGGTIRVKADVKLWRNA